MATWEEWQERKTSEKKILAEISLMQHLRDWTKTGGYTNVYELDINELPRLNHLPQFSCVCENGTDYTERSSVSNVDSNASSYYYDQSAAKLYIHTSGSDDPDGKTSGKYNYTVLSHFEIYFSSGAGMVCNGNYYFPRVAAGGLSDLSVTSRTIYFGTQTTGVGTLRMLNNDGFFDILLKRYIWQNRPITILLGGDELAYSDYETVFKGFILDWDASDQGLNLKIEDYRALLNRKFPINTFSVSDYPNLDTDQNVEGQPIPVAYGYVEGAPAYAIDSTYQKGKFKFADHPVERLVTVYNNGSPVSTGQWVADEANGEFYFKSTWAGPYGTVTVDFFGVPGDSIIFSDDYEDGDISGYTEYEDGGSNSWSAASGLLTGSVSTSSYMTALIKDDIDFYAGTIEVDCQMMAAGNTKTGMGIAFDFTDINNFYYFLLWPESSKCKLFSVASGTPSGLDETYLTLATLTTYTVSIEVSTSGTISAKIDGAEKCSYAAGAAFSANPVGMVCSRVGYSQYDDFSVEVGYLSNGADVVEDICTRFLDIDSGDIDSASFDFSSENAWQQLTVYAAESQEEVGKVIERICHSNLCRFCIGPDGKVFYSYWDESQESDATIENYQIIGGYGAEEKEDEIYDETIIKYGRSTGSEWFYEYYTDEQVQYLYGANKSITFETYLKSAADAEDLAYRYFNLVREPVVRYQVKTKLTGVDLKIGDLVTLKRGRGVSLTGTHNTVFRIVGIKRNFSKMTTILELIANTDALRESLCAVDCQTACEQACQETCQLYCQTGCELTCEGACQASCQTTCQSTCQDDCEIGCEGTCQGTCEDTCELACQDTCELACQASCETTCQEDCQLGCRLPCEVDCQVLGENP
jgi:hypothetical protein